MRSIIQLCGLPALAAAIAAGSSMPVGAQEAPGPPMEETARNSLGPGSWSVQFQINRVLKAVSIGSLDVSVKRHFTRRSAVRFGVRIDADFEGSASDQFVEFTNMEDEWVDTDEELDYSDLMLLFEALYLGYFRPEGDVSLFLGAGPVLGFSRITSDRTRSFYYADGSTSSDHNTSYYRSWIAGGLGIVGAEYFITRRFSIHAEYRVSLLYERGTGEQTADSGGGSSYDRTFETTTREWSLDAGMVLIGLSGYF